MSSVGAQSFATGSNSTGYTITEVQVQFYDIGTNTNAQTSVKIRNNSASGLPGTLVATLTRVGAGSLRNVTATFTAPSNTTLIANSTYWLMLNEDVTGAQRANLSTTTSDNETGADGWSIGNTRRWQSPESGVPGSWSSAGTSTNVAKIAIRGYANARLTREASVRLSWWWTMTRIMVKPLSIEKAGPEAGFLDQQTE